MIVTLIIFLDNLKEREVKLQILQLWILVKVLIITHGLPRSQTTITRGLNNPFIKIIAHIPNVVVVDIIIPKMLMVVILLIEDFRLHLPSLMAMDFPNT